MASLNLTIMMLANSCSLPMFVKPASDLGDSEKQAWLLPSTGIQVLEQLLVKA